MPAYPIRSAKSGRRWGLITFWAVILTGTAAGCLYLQILGPPPPGSYDTPVPIKVGSQAEAPPPGAPPAGAPAAATPQAARPSSAVLPAASATGAGTKPLASNAGGAMPLPGIATSPPLANVPRIAVVIAGLGDDPLANELAARLPPEFALALSPYGKDVTQAADAARQSGHETLLLLPMPGLLAGASLRQNQNTLQWAMAQFQGYAGVTDAFGPAMGGGFMASAPAKIWLMTNIARHGLFYIEGDPGAPGLLYAAGRKADIVITGFDGAAAETNELSALVSAAQTRHAALGILVNPTPKAIAILHNWNATLVNRHVLLVPVSALVQPPDVPLPQYASTKP